MTSEKETFASAIDLQSKGKAICAHCQLWCDIGVAGNKFTRLTLAKHQRTMKDSGGKVSLHQTAHLHVES